MDGQLPILGDSAYARPDPGETVLGSPAAGEAFGSPRRSWRKRAGGAAGGAAALAAKFGSVLKAILVGLPKLKLLTTAGTALVSVAAYSLFWGWQFAAGFVALMFVHEMGHAIQLRREGIKASTPMFIPFLGAAIFSRSLGENAAAEARVGLAGPVLGTLGAGVVALAAALTGSDLLRALAYVGFLLNLINLVPVVPFDGGRAMAAIAPRMWFVGIAAIVAVIVWFGNPFLWVFLLLALLEMPRRWRQLRSRTLEQAAYYRVSRGQRLAIGLVYIGLVVLLGFGMSQTHVLSSAGHSFRSI